MRYFRLLLFFTLMIIVMGLLLWKQSRDYDKTRVRAAWSDDFIRQSIRAAEQERKRISMELHDTVIAGFRESIALCKAGRAGEAADKQRGLLDMTRGICMDLLPPDFGSIAFTDALAGLGAAFEKRSGVPCAIRIDEGSSRLIPSAEVQLQCYRLVQEALTNIEKHAEAATASLIVRRKAGGLIICVSDDGRSLGDEPLELAGPAIPDWLTKQGKNASLGLRNMYERSVLAGGKLTLRSGGPGGGLLVKLELPVPGEQT
jgi:signal transduction histidine kinase